VVGLRALPLHRQKFGRNFLVRESSIEVTRYHVSGDDDDITPDNLTRDPEQLV
jgi:hypothetical protein